ncbi:sulfatase family protein [Altererythrobacter lutimaris]|uniref:Arylsulfatase n=1 Tax=Altererythrobacter lutimaris TaxID=2743979 RepID=A0A850H9C7_9SPHN|nr:arylsulfatase [Altererythrobacter lutimaris]NVE94369.1 arylsulfatase [Altererythrobacter lutimaris]
MRFQTLLMVLVVTVLPLAACSHLQNGSDEEAVATLEQPNIVLIYMDDLGYGDLALYNAAAKIETPVISELAEQGVVFTDAHSPSSVCTPSRYGLLTGRYAWRTWLKVGVLGGYSPPLIRQDELTLMQWLKRRGYSTSMVGKWHLGFGDAEPDMSKFLTGFTDEPVEFTTDPGGGPNAVGFDYFFGLSASLDFPPYAFLENGAYVDPPDRDIPERREGEYLDGLFYWRAGEIAPGFDFEQVEPILVRKAVQQIEELSNGGQPFFLYYASPAPHTPVLPTADFHGASQAGEYGDFVAQTDHSVGLIVDALKRTGEWKNTILIFTSDNGAVHFSNLEEFGHVPNAPFSGQKSELTEGGHRVPFIVTWPDKVRPRVSDDLVIQTDLFATIAELLGGSLAAKDAADSFSFARALGLGATSGEARSSGVHHSLFGTFAYRKGNWKLVLDGQSGGYGSRYPELLEGKLPNPPRSTYRLYDLSADPTEQTDLAAEHPDLVDALAGELEAVRDAGYSRPGAEPL